MKWIKEFLWYWKIGNMWVMYVNSGLYKIFNGKTIFNSKFNIDTPFFPFSIPCIHTTIEFL